MSIPYRPALSPSDVADLIASLHPCLRRRRFPSRQSCRSCRVDRYHCLGRRYPRPHFQPPSRLRGRCLWLDLCSPKISLQSDHQSLHDTPPPLNLNPTSELHPLKLLPISPCSAVGSVLIPKSSKGYRPLGIGDALCRLVCTATLLKRVHGLGSLLAPLQ